MAEPRLHGGTDAQGVPLYDFSTCSNACGPFPGLMDALQSVDIAHYPDPTYMALRESLAAYHQVGIGRILLAASASEFIFRISALVSQTAHREKRPGTAELPPHGYGDYRHAALAWGLVSPDALTPADLIWTCDPASPTGQKHAGLARKVDGLASGQILVLDGAYRPLRLEGALDLTSEQLNRVWQLWSPNKALGCTGIRGAYAIAPHGQEEWVSHLERLAPSWPIGAHGCAMLQAWTHKEVQDSLAQSLLVLQRWKTRQLEICASLGMTIMPSEANFYLASWGRQDVQPELAALRVEGIKLRDTSSFGLPGWVRMRVMPPVAQDALWKSGSDMKGRR